MHNLDRIPNFLSLSRVPLGALLVVVYSDTRLGLFLAGLGLILLALLTDVLDGQLARRLHVESKDGYLLDGLGDRSIYIALILVFHSTHEIFGIVAWLLILREVGIYAIRVIEVEWSLRLKGTRTLSLAHALFLRLWFGLMVVEDGLWILAQITLDAYAIARTLGVMLLLCALVSGYSSIYLTATTPTRDSK